MEPQPKIRFVLIGGFLGAGKTTLIGHLARRYMDAGLKVGIITNDQTDDLVDTQNLRGQGFDVGEVSGACFCCSFDNLVSTAERFTLDGAPDVLLAEPVGSCTDLVATVVLPLQNLWGHRIEMSPFGVLLKPSHGLRILGNNRKSSRSGFSPQADYIFRKQLEEADYLMIGRSDQLNEEELASLTTSLKKLDSDVPVIAVSPKTGDGIDQVLGYIESPMIAGKRLLDIDYDTYADGEAELGWVNLSATGVTSQSKNLDVLAAKLVERIASCVTDEHGGQIAHLKASVLAGDTQAVANVVSNDGAVDVGLAAGRPADGQIQMIVNARVAMDPTLLEKICKRCVEAMADESGISTMQIKSHSLRPGRPTPTHRVMKPD